MNAQSITSAHPHFISHITPPNFSPFPISPLILNLHESGSNNTGTGRNSGKAPRASRRSSLARGWCRTATASGRWRILASAAWGLATTSGGRRGGIGRGGAGVSGRTAVSRRTAVSGRTAGSGGAGLSGLRSVGIGSRRWGSRGGVAAAAAAAGTAGLDELADLGGEGQGLWRGELVGLLLLNWGAGMEDVLVRSDGSQVVATQGAAWELILS